MANNYYDIETRREKDYRKLRTRNPICLVVDIVIIQQHWN